MVVMQLIIAEQARVAPLAGSVDRNFLGARFFALLGVVAPLAGSVDRNSNKELRTLYEKVSLPSRGAWIEMPGYGLALTKARSRSPRGERG